MTVMERPDVEHIPDDLDRFLGSFFNRRGWRSEIKRQHCYGKQKCSAPELYLIELRIDEIPDPQLRKRLVSVPTDFSLPLDVVNDLVNAGHLLLQANPEYQRLLQHIGAAPVSGEPASLPGVAGTPVNETASGQSSGSGNAGGTGF